MKKVFNLILNGTFVADPLATPLNYWGKHLPTPIHLQIATYNQIFQDLLNSTYQQEKPDAVVICIRFQDWFNENDKAIEQQLKMNIDLFTDAILSKNHSVNFILCICPSSSLQINGTLHHQLFSKLAKSFQTLNNVNIFDATEISNHYFTTGFEIFNKHTDEIGHMPYSQNYYDTLGTFICQKLYSLYFYHTKVIALDCDNTLWEGVSGEIGWRNVNISTSHQQFQRQLINLYNAGVLLCLCSKNHIGDVKQVFENNSDMILKWDHFVSTKVNWKPKSINLHNLSKELNLNLQDFVLFDDNPIEIAEVNANAHQVTAIQLSTNEETLRSYLNFSWMLQKYRITETDKARTHLYKQEQLRVSEMSKSHDLLHFFHELNLKVAINEITESEFPRAAQLTQRTNQFNFAKVEYTEPEIEEILSHKNNHILTIYVSDRFGDYGLTGLVIYHDNAKLTRQMDNLLLSCRVLGRGVEHQVVRFLATKAKIDKIKALKFYLVHSDKNTPAREFSTLLQPISQSAYRKGELLQCNPAILQELEFIPVKSNTHSKESTNSNQKTILENTVNSLYVEQEREQILMRIQHIHQLQDVIYITQSNNHSTEKWCDEHVRVLNSLQSYVQRILLIEDINNDENLWNYGLSSLQAVQILGLIYENFNVSLPVRILQKAPTVTSLTMNIISLLKKNVIHHTINVSENFPESCPLSNQQVLVWSLAALDHNARSLNVSVSHRLDGALDVEKLQMCLNMVVTLHGALRSTFTLIDNKISQKSRNIKVFPFKKYKLITSLGKGSIKDIETWVNKFTNKQFNISHGAPVRAGLLILSDKDSILTLCFHHLVIDEWSLRLIYQHLSCLYNDPNSFKRLRSLLQHSQYSDYTQWQLSKLVKLNFNRKESYWLNKLTTFSENNFPLDHKLNTKTKRMGLVYSHIPTEVLTQIKTIKPLGSYSTFTTLLSAMLVTLRAHMSTHTPHIATAFANRNDPKFHSIIGLMSQVFPVICPINDNDSFHDILEKTKTELYESGLNSEICLSNVFGELGLQPNLSPHPFLQIGLIYYPENQNPIHLNGIQSNNYIHSTQYNQFDIAIIIREHKNSLNIEFQFNKSHYLTESIERLSKHFSNLLNEISENPNVIIKNIDFLTPVEKSLLVKWSHHNVQPTKSSLLKIFFRHVKNQPNKIALKDDTREFTYGEIDKLSDHIANQLQFVNRSKETTTIGVLLEQSAEFVLTILAILKANATYLPIDTKYPRKRIHFMLEKSKSLFCITSHAFSPQLENINCEITFVDDILSSYWRDDDSIQHNNLKAHKTRVNRIAAILFTSGTTGFPKATAISDYSIIQLSTKLRFINFRPKDNIAQVANITFDVSVFEIWSSLLNGATLSIIKPEIKSNFQTLRDSLRSSGVNTITLTTSHFNAMVFDSIHIFENIERVIIGGEQLNAKAVNTLLSHPISPRKIFHAYGITEATAITHLYPIKHHAIDPIPIGYPCCGISAIILDQNHRLVPIGSWGELYLSGKVISPGYIDNSTENKNKFITINIPGFTTLPQSVFKTGDRVRFSNSGTLEFGGRFDRQIKHTGYRIEIDEIEKAYQALPEVQFASIQPIEKGNNVSLHAYVKFKDTFKQGTTQSLKTIKSQLSTWLPSYMLPQKQFAVSKFPLTSRGKVDTHNLNRYLIADDVEESSIKIKADENNGILQSLAILWCAVLEIKHCAYDINFFDSGGNSLLFTILLARVQSQFSATIASYELLKQPTIRNLATLLKKQLNVANNFPPCIQPIKLGAAETIVFIHPISGLITEYYTLAEYLPMNILGIVSPTLLDENIKFDSINAAAKYYLNALITSELASTCSLAGWSFGGLIALEISRISKNTPIDIEQVYLIDTFHPKAMNDDVRFDQDALSLDRSNSLIEYHTSLAKRYEPIPNSTFCLIEASEGKQATKLDNDRLGWDHLNRKYIDHFIVNGNHHELFSGDAIEEICSLILAYHKKAFRIKVESLLNNSQNKHLNENPVKLTHREAEITLLFTQGNSPNEIANTLRMSPRTIHSYVDNIKYKFGVHSNRELISLIMGLP